MPNRSIREVIDDRFFLAVPTDLPVQDAAGLMKKYALGALLVVEGGHLAGMCTERDMVAGVLAAGRDPQDTTIGEIMTSNPMAVPPEMPFGHALHLMFEGGLQHLPVVNAERELLGVVSASDALQIDMIRFGQELNTREELAQIL